MYRFAIIVVIFLSGCTSVNFYLDEGKLQSTRKYSDEKVFVTNPESQQYQYEILQKSKLYSLVNANETDKVLTLKRGVKSPNLSEFAIITTALTLGSVPVEDNVAEYFCYSLEENGVKTDYLHSIPIIRRESVWEFFAKPFSRNREELIIEALPLTNREVATYPCK